MDLLTPLLQQSAFSARVFHHGNLCHLVDFDPGATAGHLHLLKGGRLSCTLRDALVLDTDRPCALLFPRPSAHTLLPVGERGADLVCATLDLGFKTGGPLAMALPECLVLYLDDAPNLLPTLQLLFDEAFSERFARQAALDRLMEYFLIQAIRAVIDSGQIHSGIFAAMTDPKLARAVNAIHARPERGWTVELLAEQAGMSRARFAARFREQVGLPPLDYLTDWRLAVVRHQLRQGHAIKRIAAQVGYASPAALSRVFAQRLGLPPSDWLKQQAAI
ncbi:helix-turn-helix domain-containing protein [Chromobacterium haemolyticum]|uniref:helix-turn-helix domain-containing protein n=1 Tax=Chromobacterium haemolyticum TaxID=394935 RepID=UPI00131731AA|nr:AraC family transcriptional regulator [Chromobacterium haemolyticum]BBH15000.1 AraC family transcriptional regulator [Chromobacterium haemolyticum]